MLHVPVSLPIILTVAFISLNDLTTTLPPLPLFLTAIACRTTFSSLQEFLRDQTVGDRVGKNEKTKVICRLQGSKAGPPSREPAVSEGERKAMMAHYFKKQEEMKKLAENDDDDFHGASWASSGQVRNAKARNAIDKRGGGMGGELCCIRSLWRGG